MSKHLAMSMDCNFLLKILLLFLLNIYSHVDFVHCIGEVIYAINAGGESHVDSNGIHYRRDPLHGRVGTASDYGKQLIINRVPKADQILYQTERYHQDTFGYEIPVNKDGNYVLVLKFCEVYFSSPGKKVFSVVLKTQNKKHAVVSGLDIFAKVGRGVAHDEHIPFTVKGNKLIVNEEDSEHDGKIRVEFMKGYHDNPKINAIYVIRGSMSDVPELPSLASDEKEEEEDLQVEKKSSPVRHPSGPRSPNPYDSEDSSKMLPIFIAVGAFLPLLFCLCRL